MSKKSTSIEVAKLAGVSQSTVSRVFSNNSPNVSEETRQRVLNAADELGYQPNIIARMMSTRQTNIIGIVMATITSPFYPYVLEKFLKALQAIDRQVLLFTASPDQSVDDILPLVLQHQVDALIITSATLSSDMVEECERSGTPVILFNRYVSETQVSAVCADNVAGGQLIADLLVDSGHSRFGYIAGQQNTSTNTDRQRGYTERLRERGITDIMIAEAGYTYESGYEAAKSLLRSAQMRPDAIFCANDIMALGAIDAARELKLNIPYDVSIVGFDDIPMAGWGAYNLTTVSQEVDEMIDATITLMLEKIDDPHSPPELRLIPGKLKRRGSVDDPAYDFSLSWDKIVSFYEHLTTTSGWQSMTPILDMISEMREREYDKKLRAGQSLATFILSRSRNWGLQPHVLQPTIRFNANNLTYIHPDEARTKTILEFDGVTLNDEIIALLDKLAEHPIVYPERKYR
ncbi:MAG: LacI family DNA-binding transcriptional regulator [Aggregatilineales bacterium]